MPDEQVRADVSRITRFLDKGEYLKAYDSIARLDKGMDGVGIQLQKLHSIVLSKLGMPEDSALLMEALRDRIAEPDWELEALIGSYYKKRWLASRKTDKRLSQEHLCKSFKSYTRARELGGDYWCAINAATLAKILGDASTALEHAGRVLEECWDVYTRNLTTSSFWIPATMGEACLVREEFASAIKWYKAARSHVGGNLGWLQSARTNAKLLIETIKPRPEIANKVLDALPRMRIALFAGHRLDEEGRASTRFPELISEKVRLRLRKELAKLHPDMGIASAADGADILFHESMHSMEKRTSVILPYQLNSFRKTLLDSVGEAWATRFDNVVEKAERVEVACTGKFEFSQDFVHNFCSDYLLVSALDMAEVNDAQLIPVVLWDGKNDRKAGGTADTVAKLRYLGLTPEWIRLTDQDIGNCCSLVSDESRMASIYPSNPVIKPIVLLFNHDRAELEEERVHRIDTLLKRIESLYDPGRYPFLKSVVFPEGLYLVFNCPEDAWEFISGFSRTHDDDRFSLVMHAGVLVNLKSSLMGVSDYYFREVDEVLAVCRTLRYPKMLCTMQARVLSGAGANMEKRFHYQGMFELDDGGYLQLFDFEPR